LDDEKLSAEPAIRKEELYKGEKETVHIFLFVAFLKKDSFITERR
jgi:hypothetical protein